MKNKLFTLIELIVVIVILSVLAAIVIPNISNFQKDGITSMVQSNIRILQTASDSYKVKNNIYPSFKQPTLENPQLIDIDRLYPDYIKSKPDYERVKNQLYWVDVFGQVWGSTVDSPYNIYQQGGSVEWKHDKSAIAYNLYVLNENKVTGKVDRKVIKLSDTFEIKESIDRVQLTTGEANFLLSAVDQYGLESAPAGLSNQQSKDWFTPILGKVGVFEFEMTSDELMYWDGFNVLEEKPEGTDIQYSFSVQNDKEQYGKFVTDFKSLAPSKGIKVKVNMISANGKLPILWDMSINYHFKNEEVDAFEFVRKENLDENKRVINPAAPVYVEEHFTLPASKYIKEITSTDLWVKAPEVNYYYQKPNTELFTPIQSFSDVPAGSTIKVEKRYATGQEVVVSPTLIEYSSREVVSQPVSTGGVTIDTELKDSEWTTVDRMNFFANSGDGQITHWISVTPEEYKPADTRILYRYAVSNGQYWGQDVDSLSKVSDSQRLRISAYLQVKTNQVGRVSEPTINSIKVVHERGVVDLDTVKPTGVIIPIKSNNQLTDTISETTKINWTFEGIDPRGKKIVESEWSGDKREQYPVGTYEVKLRVKNESNYWSDYISYKFEVKSEKPVAVIKPDTKVFKINKPLNLDGKSSYDPDGDGIEKVEWSEDITKSFTLGNHRIGMRVQDKEGYWSDWVYKDIFVSDSIFSGIDFAAFDRDDTTYYYMHYNDGNQYITWDEDITNQLVQFKLTGYTVFDIQVVDKDNKPLEFMTDDESTKYMRYSKLIQSQMTYVNIVIPPNAAKIRLSHELNGDRNTHIKVHDVSIINRPAPVTNLKTTSLERGFTVTYTKPSEAVKTAIYVNDKLVGESLTGEYTVQNLFPSQTYKVSVQSIDSFGIKGARVYMNASTISNGVTFDLSPLGEMLYEGSIPYYYLHYNNGTKYITWNGDLANKTVHMKFTGYSVFSIKILDENDNPLTFTIENNQTQTNHLSQFVGTLDVNIKMPSNASKIRFSNELNGDRNTHVKLYDMSVK